MSDESWQEPNGPELKENVAALRRMRLIVWVFIAGIVDLAICVVVYVIWNLF